MDEQLQNMKLDDSLAEKSENKNNIGVSDGINPNEIDDDEEKIDDLLNEHASENAILMESQEQAEKSSIEHSDKPVSTPIQPLSSGAPRVQRREDDRKDFSIILRSRGRAFSQALMTFAGTKQRSSRLWLTFGAMLIVIALLIIQVAYRHRELNLGYELSDAISQREALLEENRKLRIELRVLSRRERLEPLAGHQLGMTVIKPEQIFIVDTKGRLKTSGDALKREDGLDNVRRVGED